MESKTKERDRKGKVNLHPGGKVTKSYGFDVQTLIVTNGALWKICLPLGGDLISIVHISKIQTVIFPVIRVTRKTNVKRKIFVNIGFVAIIKVVINGDKWIISTRNGKTEKGLSVHYYIRQSVLKNVTLVEEEGSVRNQK
jgi:hypothetical protein